MYITISQLADAVAKIIRPAIPLEEDLWDADLVAAYLKVTARQVRERYALMPSFPAAIRLPTAGNGVGHPRWQAVDIIQWALRHKVKKQKAAP